MATTRSLNVVISGDATKLKGAFTQAGDHAEKFGRKTEEASHRAAESFKHVHEASKLLLEIGGLSSLAFGLKDVTEEAVKAETEQKKLEATVKTAGLSWKAHGKEIDEWLDKTSRASGFVKSDLTSSLSNLIRVTGSVSKARKLESEAMDVSRARGTSLASAQQLLARVYAGSFTSLQRLGIPVKAVTAAQDKLRETTKNATADQIAHAKAVDKQATVTKALGLVQDKFGGQSKAFASSTAGSFQRAKASLDLFEEGVGKVVLPIMAKAANAIANVATVVSEKWPAIEKTIAAVVAVVKAKITDWITKNRGDINSVIKAFTTFGEAVKTVFEKVALPIIKRTVAAIGPYLSGLADVIRGVVRLVSGLLSGDWSKAWSGAKEAVGGAFKAIKTVVVTELANLWTILKGVGPTVIKLIVKGLENLGKALATGIYNGVKAAVKAIPGMIGGLLKGIGHTITHGISSAIGALNPFGDGIGKTASSLTLPNLGAFPAGGLHGARPSMGPFAALGARFGLHVSSGRDDHSVMTSSGNVSYHSTGEAIDEAGPAAGMMAYFQYLKGHFGGRLAELIYGPGRVGIKDGRPFNFGPALNAQHMDHVHVAFDSGAPGVGDGHGRTTRKPGTGDGIGFGGLEDLWVRGGGPRNVAPLMAHVALAESGGNPNARNASGASGLWQILGKPFKGNVFDPLTNAKMAVWKYQHQGLGAWAASRGSWGAYVNDGEVYTGNASGGGKHPSPNPVGPPGHGSSGGPSNPRNFGPALPNPNTAVGAFAIGQQSASKGRRRVRKGRTAQDDFIVSQAQGDGSDPNQALIDSNNAVAAAQQALADQLAGVQAEQKRSNDIAAGLQATSGYQAQKYLSDILSGMVVRGVIGRNATPGTGVEVAY